jgi:ribosome-binding ATPase YchF (GTP1/OBG family)
MVPLTNRPVLAVVNIDESQLDGAESRGALGPSSAGADVAGVRAAPRPRPPPDAADRAEMLEGLGLGEGALPRFVHAAYHLLGLRTFLTTGDKESRAWTFRAGSKAPECAGRIHSDLQRGFIRAEVIHWDELLDIGSWNKAKELGKIRFEGKEYEVVDGDVLEIRFNV